jgi:putative PIN family toxin of toxin-antitoxin system
MKIVLDTNVIVSALIFGGLPRRIFEMVESGSFSFYYSPAIESETHRVLRDKFGWDEDKLERYLPVLWRLGERVVPRMRISAVREDPDDDRILECAAVAGAQAIVSGDGHLLKMKSYEGIKILSPRELLESALK